MIRYIFLTLLLNVSSFAACTLPKAFKGSMTVQDYCFASAVAGIFSAYVFWKGIK